MDVFSGGERARLALALIAWRKPNVLLLDEPTNHLDLDMREALAEALADFDGAIVLVSHDRHLIGLVSETFWRVADGRVESFDGDLDEYATWLSARANKSAEAATGTRAPPRRPLATRPPPPARPKAKPDPQAAGASRSSPGWRRRWRSVAAELAMLEGQLAEPAVYADQAGQLARLTSRHAAVREAHEALEAEWLALYGELQAG